MTGDKLIVHRTCAPFDVAYDSFIQSLPTHERQLYAPCASAGDLIASVQKLDVLTRSRQRQRTSQLLGGVKTFVDRLQAYFGIVDTVIQCDPHYAAIVWGALKLVLVVSMEYSDLSPR